jgi:hypothetical protein
MVTSLLSRAREEARECYKNLPCQEQERHVISTANENLARIRHTWYRVRDEMVGGNKIFFHFSSENGPEKLYAPQSPAGLGPWCAECFLKGGTFFLERPDGSVQKIGTANPVHVHQN